MKNTKLSIGRNSINYGIILGFTLIIISVISYLFGSMDSKTGRTISSFFQYAIIIIGIILGTKNLRTSSGGNISYGRALGSGTLICVFASVILAIYMYIFYKFIDSGSINKMLEIAEQNISDKNLSDEQVELSMQIARKTMTPAILSLGIIWSFSFMGFIFSLFTSIFLKRQGSTIPWSTESISPTNENEQKVAESEHKNIDSAGQEATPEQGKTEEPKSGETQN